MISGEDDEMFEAFRDSVGHPITKEDGTKGRGFNLNTCYNLENAGPEVHRQFDGRLGPGSGLFSMLPHDPPLEVLADEIGKNDGRTIEELAPGVVFEYQVMPWDGRKLYIKVSDQPFRTADPSSVAVPDDHHGLASSDLQDPPADDDHDEAFSQSPPDGGIIVIPMARVSTRVGFALPKPNPRTFSLVLFPSDGCIVRSILHPVLACHDIMVKLRYRRFYQAEWPPEMKRICGILAPRTVHWFPEPPPKALRPVRPEEFPEGESKDDDAKKIRTAERKARTTATVPKAPSRRAKTAVDTRTRGAKPLDANADATAPSSRLTRKLTQPCWYFDFSTRGQRRYGEFDCEVYFWDEVYNRGEINHRGESHHRDEVYNCDEVCYYGEVHHYD
ncbi:hypothetical protein EV714DRAFT_269566 [Schizophyllum commune]